MGSPRFRPDVIDDGLRLLEGDHTAVPGVNVPILLQRRDAMGRAARNGNFVATCNRWSAAMPQPNDLSRSLVALDQDSTLITVVEMSQSSCLANTIRAAWGWISN
jgi:hypothetical protein